MIIFRNQKNNRAKVIVAQSEVPHAMAEAFKAGNLGVMDYYNMMNVQSDTEMRKAVSEVGKDRKHIPAQK